MEENTMQVNEEKKIILEPQKKKQKSIKSKSRRTARLYPRMSFEDTFVLGQRIQKLGAGEKVRRLTLFQDIEKSPTSSASKLLITNSNKYGITIGSYIADWLELTPNGKIASDPNSSEKDSLQAKFALAIEAVPAFKKLYNEYKNKKIPAHEVIRDFLQSTDKKIDDVKECVDLFIVNVKYLGLLRMIAGSEILISLDQALDEKNGVSASPSLNRQLGDTKSLVDQSEQLNLSNICFYITAIGEEGTEIRKHSDLFLNSIIEPALKDLGLSVVRADKIGESGIITSQILDHLLKAKLVIVDLSFHNPNVFYELAIRHATKLPIVQIIRKSDKLPFDVDQVRTIQIDITDIYSLVPNLETYRSEISTHVRQVLANTETVSNPLTVFCPGFRIISPK